MEAGWGDKTVERREVQWAELRDTELVATKVDMMGDEWASQTAAAMVGLWVDSRAALMAQLKVGRWA